MHESDCGGQKIILDPPPPGDMVTSSVSPLMWVLGSKLGSNERWFHAWLSHLSSPMRSIHKRLKHCASMWKMSLIAKGFCSRGILIQWRSSKGPNSDDTVSPGSSHPTRKTECVPKLMEGTGIGTEGNLVSGMASTWLPCSWGLSPDITHTHTYIPPAMPPVSL